MIRVSADARYAIRILVDLAQNAKDATRPICEVAKRQEISEKFVSRLVTPLKRAGFLKAVRGAAGGIQLAKKPGRITVLDVVETIQGLISIVECVTEPKICSRSRKCQSRLVWKRSNDALRTSLKSVTIQSIAEKGDPGPIV